MGWFTLSKPQLCNYVSSSPTTSTIATTTVSPTTYALTTAIATTAILVNSNACFSATSYVTDDTFNPTQNGDIVEIKLIHVSGSVICDNGFYSNWGCQKDNQFFVQMIKHGTMTYYTTETINGISKILYYSDQPYSHTCSNGCNVQSYKQYNKLYSKF